jgi:hypothetical protein
MAPPWQMPKPRRRLQGGLTGNALVSAVIAAIVSGVISFAVAHYQDQDSARQAVTGEQVSAALQLEAAATTFYQATNAIYEKRITGCGSGVRNAPICLIEPPDYTTYATYENAFNAVRANVSDGVASIYAGQIATYGLDALINVGTAAGGAYQNEMNFAYQELITRCGQIIQGQS